jgi:hypothetical protein
MTNTQDIRTTLQHFAENIDKWRAEASRLRAEADGRGDVSTELLVHIEDVSGKVYREIESLNAVVAEVGKKSPQAAGELAQVGEALHLVLLDITEIGTGLYSARSTLPADPDGTEGDDGGLET